MASVSAATYSSRSPSPANLLEETQWQPYLELPGTETSVFLEEISDRLISDLVNSSLPESIGSAIVVAEGVDASSLGAVRAQLMRLGIQILSCEQMRADSFDKMVECLKAVNLRENILILAARKEEAAFLAACFWIFKDSQLPDPARFGKNALQRAEQAGIKLAEPFRGMLGLFATYLLGEFREVPFLKDPPKLPPKPPASPRPKEPPQSQPKKEESKTGCCSCCRWLWTRKPPEKKPLLSED